MREALGAIHQRVNDFLQTSDFRLQSLFVLLFSFSHQEVPRLGW
jgi:hypothetical protein